MKKSLFLLVCVSLCLSSVAVHGQLVQSSSLITTVEKLQPVKRGYQSNIQFSIAATNPQGRSLDLSLSYIGGFRFNNMFYLGAGAEVEYAATKGNAEFGGDYMDQPDIFLPVFAHFRVYFLKKRVSPFFALSGGYVFGIPNKKEFKYNEDKQVKYNCGSLFVEPILGVNARVTHKTSLYFSVSYRIYGQPRMQNAVRERNEDGVLLFKSFDIKSKTGGALRLNIGVTF